MHSHFNRLSLGLLLTLSVILSGCNGNSSNNNTTASIVQLDEIQHVNQSVDLLLLAPNQVLSNIRWQQVTGEAVSLLAANSKVISFTPAIAGEYRFTVSFTNSNNIEQTLEKNVVIEDSIHKVTARLSHAALAENKVSFRSELDQSIDINTLVWQQLNGPKVVLSTESSNKELVLFFDAPRVDFDTIITFEVSATDSSNAISYHDQVAVLIEAAPLINKNAYFSDRKATTFAYNSNSPHAQSLVRCVYSNTLTSSCTLAQTPLIADEVKGSSATPTIENIMDRVVVSHQWMGDRFKDFITHHDDNNDIKNLLRATTAIVIAYDVRPSFYWAATGAIYLDAENFWLTPQERDTINEAPDFRADFGNDLQFVMPWRYVKDNAYASQSYSRSARVNRSAEEALYRLTSLMYHELAHANDFFPSNEWYVHNSDQRVLDAAQSSNWESDELAIALPLASQEMRDLGQVSFAGETANKTQKSYLPSDIAGFFSPDRATDFYAYSSKREDYAMLFEELMMQSRFSVIRDVAITNQPSGENISGSDYIVSWGQRGRIGDDKLKERVLFSARRVLPEFDSLQAMSSVPVAIEMIEGDSWIDNLTISPEPILSKESAAQAISFKISASETPVSFIQVPINTSPERKTNFNRYYQKPLPNH